ncbi:MAG: response regulator [Hydrogenophaga sp.]
MADSPLVNADMPRELIELKRGFVSRLPSQLHHIADLFQSLSSGRWERETGETLHRMVHSLTGTSGTFGLRETSLAARQLESQLSEVINNQRPPHPAQWTVLERSLNRLRDTLQPAAPAPPLPTLTQPMVRPSAGTLVHLVMASNAASEQLQTALTLDGFRVELFTQPEDFRANAEMSNSERAAAVVLDIPDSQGPQAAPMLMSRLELEPNAALIVALNQTDLPNRIAVARAGARRSLPHPLEPERLIDALNSLTGRTSERPWRVLLVDDEAMALQAHAIYLRQAGMEVRTLVDPMQTLDEINRFEPDVLVLDVYMPVVNGPELAAALRESNACPHLAIVFLSAETDMTQQLIALNLGGDDFLIKPVQPAHLVAAVTARARRARQNQIVQNRLETNLYERQREHLALNEHAIVSMANASGDITYANDLFCKVSGYRREEVLGENHRLLKSDEHPPEFFSDMWATITAGRVWQGEICCQRRDRSPFWVECTITPFLDSEGMPYQYVSIQTDISHIKAAEAALRLQRDMQRMVSLAATRLMAAPANMGSEAVRAALRSSGEHLGAEHAFLFRISKGGVSMRNTHFWNSPGANLDIDHFRTIQLQQFNWMREWFNRDGMVVVPEVLLLPEEAAVEKAVLMGAQVRALIAFPLLKNGVVSGFLGYTSHTPMPSWTPEVSELLSVLSEVIASALARQRAESALRESEARLSFLVSSSPVTIYTRSAQSPFALNYVSPNATELMGYDPAEFTTNPDFWINRVHASDLEQVAATIPQMLDGGVHHQEYRVSRSDGSYRWVQDQLRLAQDEASGEAKLVGYWMDITERKRIETELSRFNNDLEKIVAEQMRNVIESERFARATLDALDARVAILDERGDILAVNLAWRESGAQKSSLQTLREGQNYLRVCDDVCGLSSNGSRVIATGIESVISGSLSDFLHEYACPNAADPRWFVCRVKRFPGDGAVRVVVSHENITALKLIERQQMRSQRLESLGTLAGGVAHDLNNSLAPILMGMGILQDQYPEEDKLITMIHNSAKRGADMVRQLLAFAKGVDGQRVALQPSQLVTELESLMKGSFPKNIEVQVQCETNLPMILGDATQLHQILLNLCVNARDAMPHGGTLTVEAKVVEIDAAYTRSVSDAKPGRYISLRVSDTGEGIPPDILDRIFDPFFTTKSQDKGTGLGLSTVLGIVKGHGGFVQVHSTKDKGSTFSVYLPASLGITGSSTQLEASKPFRGQGETILFVDDEPAVREIGQTVLQRLNFTVIVAVDGEDALIKATENRASLKAIITDMHMPHMDGLSFVHAVRRTLPNIPIILASGRIDDAVARDFRALGVDARLDKPFTETQLAEKLRVLLQLAASSH